MISPALGPVVSIQKPAGGIAVTIRRGRLFFKTDYRLLRNRAESRPGAVDTDTHECSSAPRFQVPLIKPEVRICRLYGTALAMVAMGPIHTVRCGIGSRINWGAAWTTWLGDHHTPDRVRPIHLHLVVQLLHAVVTHWLSSGVPRL
jgi:hypothetical protein